MRYSKAGLQLTERFESCRLLAYRDSVGVWTIGYGHTSDVHTGQACTQAEAEAWLLQDLATAETMVRLLVGRDIRLSQGEYDALVDFTFNLGGGNLKRSALLLSVNRGHDEAAAKEFEKWDKAGGKVVAGLLRRRSAERALFIS